MNDSMTKGWSIQVQKQLTKAYGESIHLKFTVSKKKYSIGRLKICNIGNIKYFNVRVEKESNLTFDNDRMLYAQRFRTRLTYLIKNICFIHF